MTLFDRAATASLVLLLAAGAPALAQTATPPAATPPAATTQAPPATPAPVPPAPVPNVPVPVPEIPPEKLAAARAVVISSGMSKSFDPMATQLEEQIPAVITRSRPDLAPDLNAVLTELKPEFDKKGEEMTDIAARIFARDMSEEDLKATAAFFETPAGKAYVKAQPIMLDELVVSMQSWTQDMSTYMMKRVQTEMEKRGKKF